MQGYKIFLYSTSCHIAIQPGDSVGDYLFSRYSNMDLKKPLHHIIAINSLQWQATGS